MTSATKEPMDRDALADLVKGLIDQCEFDSDQRREKRLRALDYYNGRMKDLPSEAGRSSHVSKDVRATIKKIVPAIRRVLLGSDQIVEYKPVGPEDVQSAKQASDYVNKVVIPECAGDEEIADAIQSALLLDEGVLKWDFEETKRVSVTTHSGLLAEEIDVLKGSEGVEVLDATGEPVTLDDGTEVEMFRARVKRIVTDRKVKIVAVPVEDFGMSPTARSIEASPIVFTICRRPRGELIAAGYDPEIVDALPMSERRIDDEDEMAARDPDQIIDYGREKTTDASMEIIEIYECFVRCDADGDGVPELREIHYVANGENSILFDDYADEARVEVLVAERIPHSAKGVSIFDDVEDLQRLKTVLTRQSLDNFYATNYPQPAFREGVIKNPEAIFNPAYMGQPIIIGREVASVRDALSWSQVPFIADKSLAMVAKVDEAIVDRTGITSAASGLDPNALQNVREQGVQMISDAASAQAWCIVDQFSKGLRRVFRGVLKLVVENQDKPRTVHLMGDEFVNYDPRSWNADMDCEIDVGLGTGTRERDMAALMIVEGTTTAIMQAMGPNNPFVGADEVYNLAIAKVKAAGIKSPEKFYKRPQPGTPLVQAGPSPEEQKLNMQMQLEDKKMAVQRDKETAQAQADVIVKNAEKEKDAQKAALEMQANQYEIDAKTQIEREKIESTERIAREKMAHDIILARNSSGGEDAPSVDMETGEIGPSKMDHLASLIGSMAVTIQQMQVHHSAPKVTEIIRDDMGRPVGAVQRAHIEQTNEVQ